MLPFRRGSRRPLHSRGGFRFWLHQQRRMRDEHIDSLARKHLGVGTYQCVGPERSESINRVRPDDDVMQPVAAGLGLGCLRARLGRRTSWDLADCGTHLGNRLNRIEAVQTDDASVCSRPESVP